jgi:purine-binding chemotaxis protein CheW
MLPPSPAPAAAPGAATDVAPTSRGGKYLTFYLADEEYGVEILKVQEIIGMQPITRVPRTPAFLRGVINLRGKVIPVVDLRERFGMAPAAVATAALRCIIVVQVRLAAPGADDVPAARPVPMGIVVDRVSEVAAIGDGDVEDAPSFGAGVRTDYLLGLGKSRTADGHGRVKLLLDIDRVLATDELAELPSVAAEAE